MATREIRVFDDPVLRKQCKPVGAMTERLGILIDDMFETMYEAQGVGLAAPQVGVLRQICVIDCGLDNPQPYVLINPVITDTGGEQTGDEGCLSFPGYKGTVTRAEHVKVTFLDRDMQEQTLEADGLLARCIQHETDHLKGIVYTDKVEGDLFELTEDDGEETED